MGASINNPTGGSTTEQMADIWRKAFARARQAQQTSTAKHGEDVGKTVSNAIRRSMGSRFEMTMRPHIRMIEDIPGA